MANNERVRVYNDSGYTFYLNVPNSGKSYRIGPSVTGGRPGSASIPYFELEEILSSDGGREVLTKRLRFENPADIIDGLGIDKEELQVSDKVIIQRLKTTNYDGLRDYLRDADTGVLERVPKLIAENEIVDVNILKAVEEVTGTQLVNRVDGVDVTKQKSKKDKE